MLEGLTKLQHSAPLKPQYSPAKHATPTHGAKTQFSDNDDDEQLVLSYSEIKRTQKVVSINSHYATALDNTFLIALNDLVAHQFTAKRSEKDALAQLLHYLSTHSSAKIRHYEIPLMLQIYSDASYLSAPKARSRAAGLFFLSDNPAQSCQAMINGAIHALCKIIKIAVGSVTKVKSHQRS